MSLSEKHALTCKINNVAPVERLVVNWFKNEKDLLSEYAFSTGVRLDSVESVLEIEPSREDNGTVYRCEALLDVDFLAWSPNATTVYSIEVHCE